MTTSPSKASSIESLPADMARIASWIEPDSRVLDLGCCDGQLLAHLVKHKRVSGYGIERDEDKIVDCIARGINVIHTDLNEGLKHFDNQSFDTVILSLTLQAMRRPEALLKEMLRVGRSAIVTFPNFAHWRNRWQLMITGKMPMSRELPFRWYDTPNIHLCTVKDFTALCENLNFSIDRSIALAQGKDRAKTVRWLPNVFGAIALFEVSSDDE